MRSRRQFDCHYDRLSSAEDAALARPFDQQSAVGVLDTSQLCGLDIGGPGGVARTYFDDGVGALAGDDLEVSDSEIDCDDDGLWRGEYWHGPAPFLPALGDTLAHRGEAGKRCRASEPSRYIVRRRGGRCAP